MADAVSFDPNVTITSDDKLVLTGSVNTPLSSFQMLRSSDDTLLGDPQITNGTWSYTQDISSPDTLSFTAAVTDTSGHSTAVEGNLSVISGITGEPFSTFIEEVAPGGNSATMKLYSDKGQLEYHIDLSSDEGTHGTFAMTGDQKNTQFVFLQDPGTGVAQTITNFHVDGTSHDSLLLPHSDFATMADLLRDTTMSGGNAVIHDPNSTATLTLMGVTKAEMKAHHSDFSFHGSGGSFAS